VPVSVVAIDRARKELGWAPKTSFEAGLQADDRVVEAAESRMNATFDIRRRYCCPRRKSDG